MYLFSAYWILMCNCLEKLDFVFEHIYCLEIHVLDLSLNIFNVGKYWIFI